MHPDDAKSRGAGAVFVTIGGGLTWWSWSSALGEGHYSLKAAIIGPTVLVLGVGLLFLFFLGYFARPRRSKALDLLETALPFAMLLVWFLPSRAFGAADPPKVETPPAPGPTNEPIEPK